MGNECDIESNSALENMKPDNSVSGVLKIVGGLNSSKAGTPKLSPWEVAISEDVSANIEVSGSMNSSGRELLIGEKNFDCSFEPNSCPEDSELLLAALRGCEESSFESGGGDAIDISSGSGTKNNRENMFYLSFLERLLERPVFPQKVAI